MEQQRGGPRETRAAPRREPGTWRIGQIAGVDVLVRSSWLLVAAFIAVLSAPSIELVAPGIGGWKYVAGLSFAVLLYLSVLLHEASHALMAQRYGLPVTSITLHFLGGVTEIGGEPDTPRREFGVSVVGPLTSLGVALVFYLVDAAMPGHGLASLAVQMLWGSNLLVGVLNLVPGLPLDGGRVLRAAVWRLSGNPTRARSSRRGADGCAPAWRWPTRSWSRSGRPILHSCPPTCWPS
jgi:Zn-dependent protease